MGARKINDEELIHELQQGNESAFNELYERYHKLVYYVAYQITRCEADAEEVKQEVFLKVIRYINDIKDAKRFKYWIVTITHNECKHLFRANKDKGMDETTLDQLYVQTEKRREFLPEENMHYQGDMEILHACIMKLNKEHREVITLKYFGQLSIDEIAELLEIPNGTVKSRLANAKKLLRADVEEYCRQNDIKLTFQMDQLGAICAMWLFHEGAEQMKPISTKASKKHFSFPNTTLLLKAGIVVSFSCCVIFGGIMIKDYFLGSDYQPFENDANFDAKETYRILKQWAHCDRELKEKSEAEKATMRPLYEQLKKNGNLYYILLERYWNNSF